jgi:hypothetical protein
MRVLRYYLNNQGPGGQDTCTFKPLFKTLCDLFCRERAQQSLLAKKIVTMQVSPLLDSSLPQAVHLGCGVGAGGAAGSEES